MIYVNRNELKMSGTLAEVSTECIMALREIYRKNLETYPEPEIATGILTNMIIKAMAGDLEKFIESEEITIEKGNE